MPRSAIRLVPAPSRPIGLGGWARGSFAALCAASLTRAAPPEPVAGARNGAAPAAPRVFLVSPLVNDSEDRAHYWLGDALAEGIERLLGWSGAETVTREERRGIERDEMGIGPLVVPTLATRLKEAQEFEADALLTGSFSASGASITISFALVDVRSSRRIAQRRLGPLPLADLAAVQNRLGLAVLDATGRRPPSADPPRAPASETRPEAYEARVKSRLEEDSGKQVAYLRRAVGADPSYLRARVDLAELLAKVGRDGEALATLQERPPRGDAGLVAQAERLSGELLLDAGRPTDAIDALRRALKQREDAATRILLSRALLARGDLAIARAEIELARRLDPADPEIPQVLELIESAAQQGSPEGDGTSG